MEFITHANEPEGIGALHRTSVSRTAPLHFHKDSIKTFLIIHGKALHIPDDQVDMPTEGSFVLVRQSDAHCYSSYQSEQFDFYNTSLRNYEFNKVINLFSGNSHITGLLSHASSPITQLGEPKLSSIHLKFEEIMSLVEQQEHSLAKIHFKLPLANVLLTRCSQTSDISPERSLLLARLSDLITDMYLGENIQEGLPALFHPSGYLQGYLSRVLRKYLDLTPTQFISNIRPNRAALLLSKPSAGILDVHDSCGLHNLSHSYHLFETFYSPSPKKYQKLCWEQTPDTIIKV